MRRFNSFYIFIGGGAKIGSFSSSLKEVLNRRLKMFLGYCVSEDFRNKRNCFGPEVVLFVYTLRGERKSKRGENEIN